MAYGGFQARGGIGATAAGLHHSSQQCRIPNPLIEARDQTRNHMVPSQICFHCATTGIPKYEDFQMDTFIQCNQKLAF